MSWIEKYAEWSIIVGLTGFVAVICGAILAPTDTRITTPLLILAFSLTINGLTVGAMSTGLNDVK